MSQVTNQQNPQVAPSGNTSPSLFDHVSQAVNSVREEGQRLISVTAQAVHEAAKGIIDQVRNNKTLISEDHVNNGAAVTQLQNDLNAAVDKLKEMGITISAPKVSPSGAFDRQTSALLKAIQEKALISETGEVFVKGDDGKIRSITNGEEYKGSFKGLVADGVAGPRTYAFLDAFIRGKAIDMGNFRVVTNGIWDIAQVPEGYDPNLAGDGAQFGSPAEQSGFDPSRRSRLKSGMVTVEDVLAMGASPLMEKAAAIAKQRAHVKSTHWCLKYVNEAYDMAGLDVHLGPYGKDAVDHAVASKKFVEVQLSSDLATQRQEIARLSNVPGVLISMKNPASFKGAGHAVTTYVGPNGERSFISDFNQGAAFDPYGNGKSHSFRVAIPIV